jgi:hypothetical protein
VVNAAGQEALRTVYFDPAFARVSIDTSVTPPRVKIVKPPPTIDPDMTALEQRVTDLEAEVAALKTMFGLPNASGWPILDTIELRRVIAKGTGSPPTQTAADFQIVTKTNALGVYRETVRIVGENSGDITPAQKLSFFGVDAVPRQSFPPGYVLADVGDALLNLNLTEQL